MVELSELINLSYTEYHDLQRQPFPPYGRTQAWRVGGERSISEVLCLLGGMAMFGWPIRAL
jgi:hypothetical protein